MDLKTITEVTESIVKVAAVLVGAGWSYWKFVIQRANEPATDIDIGVNFVGKQQGQWIIEVTVTLENKSLVRLRYEDFQLTVRYLLPEDGVEDGGPKVNHQLRAWRTIDERIGGGKRYFSNVEYINPKQVFRQRYITYVPGDTTFVWIQTKFFFQLKGREKVNSQKIFGVPKEQPASKAAGQME